MYAVVNHLQLKVSVAEIESKVESEAAPLLASYPGFQGFYFVQESENRAIVILVWDGAESAANAAKEFGSAWFNDNIIPILSSPQDRHAGPVVAMARK